MWAAEREGREYRQNVIDLTYFITFFDPSSLMLLYNSAVYQWSEQHCGLKSLLTVTDRCVLYRLIFYKMHLHPHCTAYYILQCDELVVGHVSCLLQDAVSPTSQLLQFSCISCLVDCVVAVATLTYFLTSMLVFTLNAHCGAKHSQIVLSPFDMLSSS